MTELTKFKISLNDDKSLRIKYLNILDELMTDGEITPEMTSVAAKKLGFRISAEDVKKDCDEAELTDAELESVSGGMQYGGELAPDGKPVGCICGFYLTWTDYWIWNSEGRCPKGGTHQLDPSSPGRVCKKCRLALDERGVIQCYDRTGREIK